MFGKESGVFGKERASKQTDRSGERLVHAAKQTVLSLRSMVLTFEQRVTGAKRRMAVKLRSCDGYHVVFHQKFLKQGSGFSLLASRCIRVKTMYHKAVQAPTECK